MSAPASAKPRANAKPHPRAPPVTSAVRPWRENWEVSQSRERWGNTYSRHNCQLEMDVNQMVFRIIYNLLQVRFSGPKYNKFLDIGSRHKERRGQTPIFGGVKPHVRRTEDKYPEIHRVIDEQSINTFTYTEVF